MSIAKETYRELEFNAVLEKVSHFAYSEEVQNHILQLKTLGFAEARKQLYAVNEFLSSFHTGNVIPFREYESIVEDIKTLTIENYRWSVTSFMKTKRLVELINECKQTLVKFEENYPTLNTIFKEVEVNKEILNEIDAVFNRFGDVKNDASPTLKSIREQFNLRKKQLQEAFSGAMLHYKQSNVLDEIGESVLDGNRVLAVNSALKKRVKGFVLGTSKTGSITFIQPDNCRKISNEIKTLEDEEKKEIDSILLALTNAIAWHYDTLALFQKKAYQLDVIQAKASYALQIKACLPEINRNNDIDLIQAYHPLLWESNQLEQKETIPQDIYFNKNQRIIAISGPNAGGKSITLKTVGLLQLMVQTGMLIPVHPNSKMSFFQNILTDIGDGQSIENQLSTYSSRLKKMAQIIQVSNEKTLLLIDEFGTGSDPELGGALAEAFLEYFYEKKCFGILTTHYTNIKIKVEELPKAINASMLFNEKTLEPIYKLEIGQAGSSFTFEVAQKNNIPKSLIERAKEKLVSDKVDLDRTIVKLQKEKFQVEKLRNELTSKNQKQQNQQDKLEKSHEEVNDKLFSLNQLYDKEQKTVFLGRRLEQMIENYSNGVAKKEILKQFMKIIEQEKYKKSQSENLQVEKEIKKIREKAKKEIIAKKEVIEQKVEEIKEQQKVLFTEGMRVKIIGSANTATIEKIEKNTAILNYGKFTTKIKLEELEKV